MKNEFNSKSKINKWKHFDIQIDNYRIFYHRKNHVRTCGLNIIFNIIS